MIQSYPWYISDWRNSETRLSLSMAQRGLYRELLDYCYLEGSLPSDRKLLLKIAGWNGVEQSPSTGEALDRHSMGTSRARIGHDLSTVLALFRQDDSTGRYHHPKVDEVLVKLVSYHEQKRHAGAKSGKARRERSLNGRSEENGIHAEPSPSPEPSPTQEPPKPPAPDGAFSDEKIPEEITADNPSVVRPDVPAPKKRSGKRTTEEIRKALGERLPWYEAWWGAFPCKDGMNPALDAFERRVHTRELALELYHGAKRYAAKCAADPTLKPKYGQGWINEERWTDECKVTPTAVTGNSKWKVAEVPKPTRDAEIEAMQALLADPSEPEDNRRLYRQRLESMGVVN